MSAVGWVSTGRYLIFMGLTMSQRRAVTRATAIRCRSASKKDKATILAELCALTGWHRDHARRALRRALGPKPVVRLTVLRRILVP